MQDFTVEVDGVPDRGPAVFIVTTTTLILATVFVGARLVCRGLIVRRFGRDDLSIVIAWLFAVGISVTIALGTHRGLGRHDEDIVPEYLPQLRRCEYVFSILYNPALMAAKTSVLIFYLRLSRNTQPLLRLASKIVLFIVNTAGTILTFINIFQCNPINAAYDDVAGQCVPLLTEFICSAPINILTDLAILALPIPVLTSMRLPPRQKTILVLTFGLGIFVTIVDVVRIYYLQNAINYVPTTTQTSDPNAIYGDSPQFSWSASLSLMWSAVEVNVGISTACIPTLKPLVLRLLPAMILDPNGNYYYGSNNTKDREVLPTAAPMQPTFGAGGGMQAAPPQHSPTAAGHEDQTQQLDVMEFLTTPGMGGTAATPGTPQTSNAWSNLRRSTVTTLGPQGSAPTENNLYFGFVSIKKPKSMLKATNAESWRYCAFVTVTFVLWGMSYGLLGMLNNVVALVADMTVPQTIGLNSIYFGLGYLLGPLIVGVWILRHDEHHRSRHATRNHRPHESIGGFKATLMLGLAIFGTGTICFWPAAVLASFPGFMVSNFLVGSGLAVLETAANPFLVLCGPSEFASMRLCLAQGFQAVGSILSGLLAQHVYFSNITQRQERPDSLILADVQWTYLAVTLFCAALALLFYYIPLPEVTDQELAASAEKLPVDSTKRSIGGLELRTVCIILAVLAQYCLIAAQESVSIFFQDLISALVPTQSATPVASVSSGTGSTANATNSEPNPPSLTLSVSNYMVISHTAFALSRFLAGGLAYLSAKHPRNKWIPTPRTVLLASIITAIAAMIAIITVKRSSSIGPNVMAIPIVIFFFAEGPGWPLIFSLGLVGQGSRTKLAAAWLTMGASGPAFIPFIIYGIIQRSDTGRNIQIAFCVIAAALCFTLVYPLYLCFGRDARKMVDPVDTRDQPTTPAAADEQVGMDTLLERRIRGRLSAMATEGREASRSTLANSNDWDEDGPRSVALFDKFKNGLGAAKHGLNEHHASSPLRGSRNNSPRRPSATSTSPRSAVSTLRGERLETTDEIKEEEEVGEERENRPSGEAGEKLKPPL
ncbi:hypothetical protein MCOR25_001849 [Pyricularia grisea]|uniref:Rhodopsin domain-containing protein n=1 Tax=Pyricularia grisea TaxID=148305 RepID=A0A6P8BBW0_PYRGI|nr:uncharacterized protein PgNI_03679 [Pyricularia grisea]KAI6379951.1 hypothetical protein MCOR25_001849 [Pyricularia grisea]TLD13320.1 hypothetical protein PgNI_03679 [Pyricularia grisea]